MFSTKYVKDAGAKHVFTPSNIGKYSTYRYWHYQLLNVSPPFALYWKCKSAIIVVENDCKDSVGTDSKNDSNGQNPSLWKFFVKIEISLS